MNQQPTTMQGPVHLMMPADPPEPAKGCGVCAALVKQRQEAQSTGDGSAASDCNVELAAHPKHRKAKGQR
ncbi:hypothetical protein OG735_28545 [Streptomyces sp. NBC_01210]|nr:hypothetical protein OG735_28545 [Streptomyces sp. NBC_01210]